MVFSPLENQVSHESLTLVPFPDNLRLHASNMSLSFKGLFQDKINEEFYIKYDKFIFMG